MSLSDRTTNEQREIAQKGGEISGRVRREKKVLRESLEYLLEHEIETDDGYVTGAEAIAAAAFKRTLSGDIKAMEFIRDTCGQKPVEKVMIADVDPAVIAEVEAMVFSDD